MRFKFYVLFILSIFLTTFELEAQRRRADPYIGGVDMEITSTNPNNSREVSVKLTYYRDCSASTRRNPTVDSTIINLISSECCSRMITFLKLRNELSESFATPECPNSTEPLLNDCYNQLSGNRGYRTEVYFDTFELPFNCSDWYIFHNFSRSDNDAFQTLIDSSQGMQGIRNANGTILGTNPNGWSQIFGGRIITPNLTNQRKHQGVFTEAWYNNKISKGLLASNSDDKFIANNSPRSAINPLIFQCLGTQREYDLGYYDPDGDILEFEVSTPYFDYSGGQWPNYLADNGEKIEWNAVANCSEANPLCGNSTYSVNASTGAITLRPMVSVGQFATAIKITERDRNNPTIVKGITRRDIVLNVYNLEECNSYNNKLANNSQFLGYENLVNCAVAPKRNNTTIEACAGESISFGVRGANFSTAAPAESQSLEILINLPTEITNAIVSNNFKVNQLPKFDTTLANFSWNIPPNMPSGTYPLVFLFRDCINNVYSLENYKVVLLRINKPVSAQLIVPTNIPNEIVKTIPSFQTKKGFFCNNPNALNQYSLADNGQIDAEFSWSLLNGGGGFSSFSSVPSKMDDIMIPDFLNSSSCFTVTGNQYCENKDTVCYDLGVTITPSLVVKIDSFFDNNLGRFLRNQCLGDEVDLEIINASSGSEFYWNYTKGNLVNLPVPIISPIARGVFIDPLNNFNVYLKTPDNCILNVFKEEPTIGVKPNIGLSTDKVNVCPFDTIQIKSEIGLKNLCGFDNFSKFLNDSNSGETIGDFSTTDNEKALIFNARNSVKFMRTQFLYRGKEELACFFKNGSYNKISFFIEGLNEPKRYSNLKIKVTCTDREDLNSRRFENDTTKLLEIYSNPNYDIEPGWNDFSLNKNFTWDGESNLIFEISASCVNTDFGKVGTPPVIKSNRTSYISVLGYYLKEFEEGWDKQQARDTSMLRPVIRMNYKSIDSSIINFNWKPETGLITSTSPNPKISAEKRTMYNLTAINPFDYTDPNTGAIIKYENCYFIDSTLAKYDDSFKITLNRNFASICNGDTVSVSSRTSSVIPEPIDVEFRTYKTNERCKVIDSNYQLYLGLKVGPNNVNNEVFSPFGQGVVNNTAPTDKKIQYIITRDELAATNPLISQGLINAISFNVRQLGANQIANVLTDFTIKIKPIPIEIDSFSSTTFIDFSICEDNIVYDTTEFKPKIGINKFEFKKPFGFNHLKNQNILVEICWNNGVGRNYLGDQVESTNLINKKRSLVQIATNGLPNACKDFFTGTIGTIRPNFIFDICTPSAEVPPVAKSFQWAPPLDISNSGVSNPIFFPNGTRKYHIRAEYRRDLFVNNVAVRDTLICIVRDTILVDVSRPQILFKPLNPAACEDGKVKMEVEVNVANQSEYKIFWDPNQIGIDNDDLNAEELEIAPIKPSYYYVSVAKNDTPRCYNRDSIWIDVQPKKIMPASLAGVDYVCFNDSVELKIPIDVGYKNPIWRKGNQIISNEYIIKVADTGRYFVEVDSGACRNRSGFREIIFYKPDTVEFTTYKEDICEGDSVFVSLDLNSGVTTPLWNDGVLSYKRYFKQGGVFFIVNPIGNNGCPMFIKDSVIINYIDNPDFALENDTLCIGIDRSKTLIPIPLNTSAKYTWFPNNAVGQSLDIKTPGRYKVVREFGGCKKEAYVDVIPETFGRIVFRADSSMRVAVCCNEQIELDANKLNRKYVDYNWSNGEKNQTIFTAKNTSGLYIVEAVRPSGCKDTGSIFIDNKCLDVTGIPYRSLIQLGDTNSLLGDHLFTTNKNVKYKWIPSLSRNKTPIDNQRLGLSKPIDSGDVEYILVVTSVDSSYSPPKECIENAVVRYRVKGNGVKIPNAFTPNGDGTNDSYYPQIDGVAKLTDFKVYNRFGQLIHNNPNKPWDGSFEGQTQPVGVYVCQITYEIDEHAQGRRIVHEQINLTLIR
jgi:gliding motility-associated-like protein